MASFMLIFVAALLLAGAATPLAQWIAPVLGVMDAPNARKIHVRPVPRLGGAAIYLATIAALLILGGQQEVTQFIGILIGATIVSFCGLWDDRRALSPLVKLVVQTVAALILYATGVSIGVLSHPLLNFAATILWVVGITNAFNLLDNMDGLSGGVSAIAALFFMVLAITSKQVLVGSLSAALLGACVGFLLYNFNPASIFMGDSGSLFIGFMLAALGIKLRFPDHPANITWMIPVIVLGVPIFDTTLVTISRLLRGKNPLTTPGQDHLSHRLVARGLTRREAVLIIYLICGALGVVGMLLAQASVEEGAVIGAVIFAAGAVALTVLEIAYAKVVPLAGK
jgi:UDP-GlcNAc:undecaprenyl-phosphate GlcNAc-1-phosphate transferase